MPRDTRHVSYLLTKLFQRKGIKRAIRRAEVVLLWPKIAGPELGSFTTGRSFKDGILYVDVPDSETSMHLSMQRERFLDAYRDRFDINEVKDLRFRTGRPALKTRSKENEPSSLDVSLDPIALNKLALKLDELNLPKYLASQAMEAGRAMLTYRARKEAEGWTPCFLCSSISPKQGLCDTCQRYTSQSNVQRASRTFTVKPDAVTPELSMEERNVARHLAKQTLLTQLNELLPQALTDPIISAQLKTAACCFLALRLERSLTNISSEDFNNLPPKLTQVFKKLI